MSMTKQEEEKRQQAHDEILYGGIRWALNIKVRAWTDRMLAALVNGVKGNVWYIKWPNKFFATAGLFSLKIAWKHDIQALKAAKAR